MSDQLRDHYATVVREIERVILARVPKVPLMPTVRPLDEADVTALAGLLAAGHDIAAREGAAR